jgi:RluA family pseudouridine synthase
MQILMTCQLKRLKSSKYSDQVIKAEIEGSKCQMKAFNSFLPVVKNVGIAEKRLQHDGKSIVTVYPGTIFHRKPLRMHNFDCSSDENESNPFTEINLYGNLHHAFLRGRSSITHDCIHASNYYFEDGLRKVRPYYMVMETIIRNLDKPVTLQEYLYKVIPSEKLSMVEMRLKLSSFHSNLRPCKPTQLVYNGDYLTNVAHRHEGAVLDQEIQVIYEDENIVVVNKPATIMVYPVGKYRFNTVKFIMAKEKGYMDLRPVHRLDKNTSGVCIFAKGPQISQEIQQRFRDTQVEKEYLALVDGEFPSGEVVMDKPLTTNFYVNTTLNEKDPKPCLTQFERLAYNHESNTSLVKCIPKTGRTHQIRKHLLLLGHPVINDYIYNDIDEKRRFVVDPDRLDIAYNIVKKRLSSCCDPQLIKNATLFCCSTNNTDWQDVLTTNHGRCQQDCIFCQLGSDYERHIAKMQVMPMCLHSYRYKFSHYEFEAPLPKWATDSQYLNEQILQTRQLT